MAIHVYLLNDNLFVAVVKTFKFNTKKTIVIVTMSCIITRYVVRKSIKQNGGETTRYGGFKRHDPYDFRPRTPLKLIIVKAVDKL